jgi:hypothetical protein
LPEHTAGLATCSRTPGSPSATARRGGTNRGGNCCRGASPSPYASLSFRIGLAVPEAEPGAAFQKHPGHAPICLRPQRAMLDTHRRPRCSRRSVGLARFHGHVQPSASVAHSQFPQVTLQVKGQNANARKSLQNKSVGPERAAWRHDTLSLWRELVTVCVVVGRHPPADGAYDCISGRPGRTGSRL